MMKTRQPRRFRLQSRLFRFEDRITPALTTTFDKLTGILTVASDASDAIILMADLDRDGYVQLNGADALDQTGQKIFSFDVARLNVVGGPGPNDIDLGTFMAINRKGTGNTNDRIVIPPNGVAINQKGTGADRNRIALPQVVIDGGAGDDTITGSPANDHIVGGAGKDKIGGGPGHDRMIVDPQDDDCDGGSGFDEVEFTLNLAAGDHTIPINVFDFGAVQVGLDGQVRNVSNAESFTIVTTGDPTATVRFKTWWQKVDGDIRCIAGPEGITFSATELSGGSGGGGGVSSLGEFQVQDFRYHVAHKRSLPDQVQLSNGNDTVTVTPGPVSIIFDAGGGVDSVFVDNGGYAFTEVGNEVKVATKAPVTLTNFESPFEHGRFLRDRDAVNDLTSKGIVFEVTAIDHGNRLEMNWRISNSGTFITDAIEMATEYLANAFAAGRFIGSSGSPGVTTTVGTTSTGATTEEIVAGVAIPKFIQVTQEAKSILPGTPPVTGELHFSRKALGRMKCSDVTLSARIGSTRYEITIPGENISVTMAATSVVTIDPTTGKTPIDAGSTLSGASADGSVVLTASNSKQLAPDGNPAGLAHLYASGILVDATPGGTSANGPVDEATIDAAGRFVAFTSSSTNLTGASDTNAGNDVFLRDAWTGQILLLSGGIDTMGLPVAGNGVSRRPMVSADGSCVIFESKSTDLIPGLIDTNNDFDIFSFDTESGILSCVSLAVGGGSTGNAGTDLQDISADGDWVVFISSATNLVSPATSGSQFFAREVNKATPMLFQQCAGSSRAYMSGDGSTVVFTSPIDYSALTGIPDSNGVNDLFHWDLGTNKLTAVSKNSAGTGMGNGSTPDLPDDRPALSFDGTVVVCGSNASDLFPASSNRVLATWDLAKNKGSRLAPLSNSGGGTSLPALPSISSDGRVVVWQSFDDMQNPGSPPLAVTQVWSIHIDSGQVDCISGKRTSNNPLYEHGSLGAENPLYTGGAVLFTSPSTNIAGGDVNLFPDVYSSVNDRALQAFMPTGNGPDIYRLQTSSGGHRVIFDDKSSLVVIDREGETVDVVLVFGGNTEDDSLVLETDSGLTGIISGVFFDGAGGNDSVQTKGADIASIAVGDLDRDGIPDIVVALSGPELTALNTESGTLKGLFTEVPVETARTFVLPHVLDSKKVARISEVKLEPMAGKVELYSNPGAGISATYSDIGGSSTLTLADIGPGLSTEIDFAVGYSSRKDMLEWLCDSVKVSRAIRIFGGDCDDDFKAGPGDDFIAFGGGSDTVDGGLGADTYAAKEPRKSINVTIKHTAFDRLDLSTLDGGVSIDLSSTALQTIAPNRQIQLPDRPPVFIGTEYSDALTVRRGSFSTSNFHGTASNYNGSDSLTFNAEGKLTTIMDARILVEGKLDATFEDFESVVVVNNAPAPQVALVQVNDGSKQRSRVTELTVAFNSAVTFTGNPDDAFQLVNTKTGQVFPCDATTVTVNGFTVVELTFGGPLTPSGSLTDGKYTLTVLSSHVTGGMAGGDYTSNFHCLFADDDGDGTVTSDDFAALRKTFGTGINLAFDSNNNGTIDSDDFASFRKNFGLSVNGP